MSTQLDVTAPVEPLRVKEVERLLQQSAWSRIRRLKVTIEEGRVTLTGSVNSYYEKQMVRQQLLRLPGARNLKNNVQVHHSSIRAGTDVG